jgi:hypothetical protein
MEAAAERVGSDFSVRSACKRKKVNKLFFKK